MTASAPIAMLAELTHRCPLACGYCSNPMELDRRDQELDTATWARVFQEAEALGVLQLHLSGGEPAARGDLAELLRSAAAAGLYTNLITSAVGLSRDRLQALAAAGLDHVQLSVQHIDEESADGIAGYRGAMARKLAFARWVVDLGLPLTLNVVLHRANIGVAEDLVRLAATLGARRIELAHAQYYGWALANRNALMPSRAEVDQTREAVGRLRNELKGRLVIDYVPPDYFGRYPKPCTNGWGRQSLNVTPKGLVLPCHAAETIPDLEFWNVRDRSLADIWNASPAFQAFRGEEWMREPCRSCERRSADFGGCRCQALALTGDARNADPVCHLSPHRDVVDQALAGRADAPLRMLGRPLTRSLAS